MSIIKFDRFFCITSMVICYIYLFDYSKMLLWSSQSPFYLVFDGNLSCLSLKIFYWRFCWLILGKFTLNKIIENYSEFAHLKHIHMPNYRIFIEHYNQPYPITKHILLNRISKQWLWIKCYNVLIIDSRCDWS